MLLPLIYIYRGLNNPFRGLNNPFRGLNNPFRVWWEQPGWPKDFLFRLPSVGETRRRRLGIPNDIAAWHCQPLQKFLDFYWAIKSQFKKCGKPNDKPSPVKVKYWNSHYLRSPNGWLRGWFPLGFTTYKGNNAKPVELIISWYQLVPSTTGRSKTFSGGWF